MWPTRPRAGGWGSSCSRRAGSSGTSCRARAPRSKYQTASSSSSSGSRPTSPASPRRSRTSRSTSSTRRRSSSAAPASCGRSRAARSSPTASSPRLPAPRGRPGRPAASAPATGSACSSPATGSSRPGASAPTARTGSSTSAGCWRSRAIPVPLSEDLRDELAAIAPASDCDRLAELSGLFHVAGSVHLRGRGEVGVHLDLVSSAVARRAFSLLRAFAVDSEIRTYQRRAFDRATRYQLHVAGSPHAHRTLHRAGVLDASHRPLDHPPQRVLARRCCRRAYLRGTLLGAGSLSGPRDPHLEIRTAELEGARFVAALAAREGASLRVLARKGHAVAYAKGLDPIADLLVAAGASDTVLMLEESSVLAAIRGDANRLANADHANLVRTSRAAHAQLEALGRLDLDALPDDLPELAALRFRHPTASIADLGRRCRPPLTKSSAYRRLRRLQELAAEVGSSN